MTDEMKRLRDEMALEYGAGCPPEEFGFISGFDACDKMWRERIKEAIEYAKPHKDKMWAAYMIGILTGSDEWKDVERNIAEFESGKDPAGNTT